MRSFDDLRSFVILYRESTADIPSEIINELNLFTGQLYFASKETYEGTCKMLGLYLRNQPEDREDGGVISATGVVRDPNRRNGLGLQCAQFSEDPVTFLRKLTGLRSKGQGFLLTHLGQVFHSREVPDVEFELCESILLLSLHSAE